ncbi:MAG TPA: diguanylate cyclase [Nitrospirota bacterium]|nr:diguanylate cyclase [Nitrospirota bacterium]
MLVARERKIYRNFILSTGLVTALVLSVIFLDMAFRTRQLMNEENLIQARVLFNTIVLTRKWNANYGGVYVEKRPGVSSNPYLEDPDIRTSEGKVFTLRNPALMTREISEYAAREGLFRFHITSLKLLNPGNAADVFETEALREFERGNLKEMSKVENSNGRSSFRYMAPLYVDESCLQCHGRQDYRLGDVRGGISITFDIEDLQKKIKTNTFWIFFFGITSTAMLLGLIAVFMARLIKKLADARQQIERIAITDELTGLYNRRHVLDRFGEEFEKSARLKTNLSCIIADIDHFKNVNDRYGHLKGDGVLKEVGRLLKSTARAYDIAGRYGGEEFLIILPATSLEQAWNYGERIRMQVKETMMDDVQVTISMGVTEIQAGDASIDDLIRRADDALYRAKDAGRDRVDWLPRF